MIRYLMFALIFTLTLSGINFAQPESPKPILPDTLKWFSPPNNPNLKAVWVTGNEKEPGMYILRVMLKATGIIPPHSHPDIRYTTVLSGTLYVGFGKTIEDSTMVAIPTGVVYCVPANVFHYLKSKTGDVTYQEIGVGPTATDFIK
jgi:quercetin dioxygenase-like cupin family protein